MALRHAVEIETSNCAWVMDLSTSNWSNKWLSKWYPQSWICLSDICAVTAIRGIYHLYRNDKNKLTILKTSPLVSSYIYSKRLYYQYGFSGFPVLDSHHSPPPLLWLFMTLFAYFLTLSFHIFSSHTGINFILQEVLYVPAHSWIKWAKTYIVFLLFGICRS